ncbi:hypothetical protein E1N52_36765 [Paraburkholderia guartelaensis]|uniref:Uncharacterized protein n=1 Tax=Paraburkholderia guartelaensis TaxID=2546446 RepID=A0A4R5L504_9BURK|nr:hypothetical protein [Paraburkholderia guartelaensis]TDG02995.1 hypothetical protein E1N52_36765 [Paraburkholderia guartelaensis]
MNAFFRDLLSPCGWLLASATFLGVFFNMMGPVRYYRYGWFAKRKDIMGGLDQHARHEYFKRFGFDEPFGFDKPFNAGSDMNAAFMRFYEKWYGRKFFIGPMIIHCFVTLIFVFLVFISVLSEPGELNRETGIHNPFFQLPFTAIAAATGAYMWVTNDFISRARRLDFAPADVAWGTLRLLVAIPMGYAFASLFTDRISPFIAFTLGAFPLSALISFMQRRFEKQLDVAQESDEAADSISKLEGVDREIRERLRKEDITTVTQIAYCDPIRLAMRSNLSFIFISDIAGQAIAWLYLRDQLALIKPFGLRGACEIRWYLKHYDLPDTNLSVAQELDRKRAREALPAIAKTLKQDDSTVLNCFKQIAYDPFTTFYVETWIDPGQPRIGLLRYGALDNPYDSSFQEFAVGTVTENVFTPFPVELARCSHARAGGPVLAPVEKGGAMIPATIVLLKRDVNARQVVKMLFEQETQVLREHPQVGIMSVKDVTVQELVNFHGIPLVFYVTFDGAVEPLNLDQLAARAIASAKHLKTGNRDGISYLIELTKKGIKTPLINGYRDAILKQTGCKTLEEALAFSRKAA